jgi:curved DNA-binding protein CbpA
MTDYFALLEQPRRPWLDPEELKQVFHKKTLEAHPDAQTQSGGDETFTQLNEAYQVLREPKRRLHHLLSLEGSSPATKNVSIPANIESLFPMVAALMQEMDGVIQKVASSSNALRRSLVRPELLRTAESTRQMLETLVQLHDEAVGELRELSKSWLPGETAHQIELHTLYLQFSYLTKWISELREKQLQLTSAL